ncbi:hypothetical protein EB093_00450 [bacterium]|nr:hypothetical protein [bacterium]
MKPFTILTLALIISASLTRGDIVGSCGATSCPMVTYRPISAQHIEFGIGYETINQTQVYTGNSPNTVGAISQPHDELETINTQFNISAKYGFSAASQLRLEVPLIYRTHSHIHTEDGETHTESWTLNGIGDSSLYWDQVMWEEPEHNATIALTGGVKFPTGVTGLSNSDGDSAEVSVQPGSGSTDYSIGMFYQADGLSLQNWDRDDTALPIRTGLTYFFRGIGTNGWQVGNSTIATLGTHFKLNTMLSIGIDSILKVQDKSSPGSTGESVENTGGTWAFLAPHLTMTIFENHRITTMVQCPVYQNVNGIQLTAPLNIRIDYDVKI